jgi:xanthine dehydrogenase accessory factor
MKANAFLALRRAETEGHPVALVTRLTDGAQCIVEGTAVSGELVLLAAASAEVQSRLLVGGSGPLDCDDGLFARIYAPAYRLLIIGAVHIAQALAPIAAIAGFQVTVIDPRQGFAAPARFPGVNLCYEWPDAALSRLAPDAQTAVVALSHDPKLDDPALAAALGSRAFYVGALGSRRTHAARVARLSDLGLGEQLSRLRAPIGLDLGGRSSAEIAVAIMAEIIQIRYQGIRSGDARRPGVPTV